MGVRVGRAIGARSVLELPLALDDERSRPFFAIRMPGRVRHFVARLRPTAEYLGSDCQRTMIILWIMEADIHYPFLSTQSSLERLAEPHSRHPPFRKERGRMGHPLFGYEKEEQPRLAGPPAAKGVNGELLRLEISIVPPTSAGGGHRGCGRNRAGFSALRHDSNAEWTIALLLVWRGVMEMPGRICGAASTRGVLRLRKIVRARTIPLRSG
jgi:hypothetical protein